MSDKVEINRSALISDLKSKIDALDGQALVDLWLMAQTRQTPHAALASNTEEHNSFSVRSPYRKPHQLPDPNIPRWAEVNRQKKQVKLRLVPELIAAVDQAATAANIDRTEWLTRAIQEKLTP